MVLKQILALGVMTIIISCGGGNHWILQCENLPIESDEVVFIVDVYFEISNKSTDIIDRGEYSSFTREYMGNNDIHNCFLLQTDGVYLKKLSERFRLSIAGIAFIVKSDWMQKYEYERDFQ